MKSTERKLVTIVTEAPLEASLVADLKRLGASGYTIWDARGEGSRGVRRGNWDQDRNICVEVVCDEQVAEAITAHCFATYYSQYAMVIHVSTVAVLRPEKF